MSMHRHSARTGRPFAPETLMMGYGYDPFLSEGSVKPPVFLTSTFVFRNAEEGKRYFQWAYGLKERDPACDPAMGLIYSRLNNPDLEILENRLATWEQAEMCLAFSSGMSAITTTILALVEPGQEIISTNPVYGGTDFFFEHLCQRWNIRVHRVCAGTDAPREVERILRERAGRIRLVYIETPSNPTISMTDIDALRQVIQTAGQPPADSEILLMVDNTFLGPIFQQPLTKGADLSVYSATKFIGGHSDLVAGAVMGASRLLKPVSMHRTILGTMADPFTSWLLMRSLETLAIRMRRQEESAVRLAAMLKAHPAVERVYYPGQLDEVQNAIWRRQCSGSGSLIAFDVKGGEEEAFRVLDQVEICKLAVSLGGTECLIEHPATMTHADLDEETRRLAGIHPSMIRVSVGLEHYEDVEADLRGALDVLL
ncbi:MAG: cystathionine gamma-synthase family protein [bacterium]|jgi:methionine-gamma-lyase|nr:cystathionine gamma-synthase family protein [bacterium]